MEGSMDTKILTDNKIDVDHGLELLGDIDFYNDISVIDSTIEEAIINNNSENFPCVLNFANFTSPGGGFIKGSIAQEEALCHASNLYNILLKFKDRYDENNNKLSFETGLYENLPIYSPSVYFNTSGVTVLANVITCPAPNYTVYKTKFDDENTYNEVLKSRIKYVLDIAKTNNQETLILGAFGYGIFGNVPYIVAKYFKELLKNYKFEKVIFAIPKSSNNNYEVFKNNF
jgi:uncharacterized protein (TIGR02452 family)